MQSSSQLQTPFFRKPQQTTRHDLQTLQRRGLQTTSGFFRSPCQHNQQPQLMGRQEQGVRSEESLTYAPALAKLKLEADKIRKWKTATQFELKKKESQLCEVKEQLRVQQEAVTGMRVREEALKTRLQDELNSHTELQHKMLVTRGLCSTLKQKVEETEAALSQGRADQNDNKDLDNLRMEQYRALAEKFMALEQEQRKVQRSLEEALIRERENGCGLTEELVNERTQRDQLHTEIVQLRDQLSAAIAEEESRQQRLREVEGRLEVAERGRKSAEQQCQLLQEQLTASQEHSLSLQCTIASLKEQISSLQTEHRVAVSGLERQLRESLQQCSELQAKTQQQLITLDTQQAELASATREKENMETALTALREELCAVEYSRRDDMAALRGEMRKKEEAHSQETAALNTSLSSAHTMLAGLQAQLLEYKHGHAVKGEEIATLSSSLAEKEALNASLQSEVKGLRECVCDLERVGEEERGGRRREKKEAHTTIAALTSQLETLQSQLQEVKKTESDKVESEKSELMKELSEMRQHLEEAVSQREAGQREAEGVLEEVRRKCACEVQQSRELAENARETQRREKDSFDTQVTELCGMLERYRSENHKIVQQKDVQIHSLQSALGDANKAKDSLEELLHTAQEEVVGLGEEIAHLQEEVRKGEEEVREREERVREKDQEMAELLKAVDTLRHKQQQSTPQSTTHHLPPPNSPQAHSPHTPQVPIVSSMVPLTAPAHDSFHSLRRQRSSRGASGRCASATPNRPPVSVSRPAVKKARREMEEDEGGVVRHKPTDQEDILFRKPRPLSRPKTLLRASDNISPPIRPPWHVPPPTRPPRDVPHAPMDEVTSTAASEPHKRSTSRIRGGKGCKLVGGGRRGERKQAGTAWFDLDAVFGFGPED